MKQQNCIGMASHFNIRLEQNKLTPFMNFLYSLPALIESQKKTKVYFEEKKKKLISSINTKNWLQHFQIIHII